MLTFQQLFQGKTFPNLILTLDSETNRFLLVDKEGNLFSIQKLASLEKAGQEEQLKEGKENKAR